MSGVVRTIAGFAVGAIGFALGGPLGFAAATLAFGVVFPAKQQGFKADNARLEINTSEYDGPIPTFFGVMGGVGGNIINVAKDKDGKPAGVIVKTKKKKVGGKGGGGQEVEEEQYFLIASYAIGIAGDNGPLYVDEILVEDASGLQVWWRRGDEDDDQTVTEEYDGGVLICEHVEENNRKLELHLGTERQKPSAALEEFWGEGNVCPHRGVALVVINRGRIRSQPTLKFKVRSATTGRREIITKRLQDCGIPDARLNLDQIEGEVEGAAVMGREPARDFCEKLASRVMCGFAFFNAQLNDYSKFNPKIWTLADADLAAREGGQARDHGGRGSNEIHNKTPFELKGEEEFQSEVSASFYDVDHNYEQNTAIAPRLSARHSNPQGYDLPEAARLGDTVAWAKMMLDEDWAADRTIETKLLPAHSQMVPGNVMRVPHRTTNGSLIAHDYLITEEGIEPTGLLTFRGVPWRSGQYELTGFLSESEWPPATPTPVGKFYFQIFDCAPLHDEHTGRPGFYVIANWSNNVSGVEFGPVTSGTGVIAGYHSAEGTSNRLPTRGTFGQAESTLPDFGGDVVAAWDDSELVIRLRGTDGVEDETDSAIENGYVNVLRIGDEIIQFVHATYLGEVEDGDGGYWQRYEISRFKRGRRATEWAMAEHASDEEVTLLDTALLRVDLAAWAIGQAVDYQFLYEEDSEPTTYTCNGVSLKPFSLVQLDGTRTGNEWTLSSVPRTRFMGWEINPAVPVLTSPPDTDTYVFEIMDGATVKRAIPGSGTGTIFVNYTEAMQVEDFGSAQSTINVRALRLSSVVTPVSEGGRGYEASASFTAGGGGGGPSGQIDVYHNTGQLQAKLVVAGTPGKSITVEWTNNGSPQSQTISLGAEQQRNFNYGYWGARKLKITGDLNEITTFKLREQNLTQLDGVDALTVVTDLDIGHGDLTVLNGLDALTTLTELTLWDNNFLQAALESIIDDLHGNAAALGTNSCLIRLNGSPGSSGASASKSTELSALSTAGCTVVI